MGHPNFLFMQIPYKIKWLSNNLYYLKTGTGNDCAGHNSAMRPSTLILERFWSSPDVTFGLTLPTGSIMNMWINICNNKRHFKQNNRIKFIVICSIKNVNAVFVFLYLFYNKKRDESSIQFYAEISERWEIQNQVTLRFKATVSELHAYSILTEISAPETTELGTSMLYYYLH